MIQVPTLDAEDGEVSKHATAAAGRETASQRSAQRLFGKSRPSKQVVLSGGEITLHPDLDRVLHALRRLRRTASTLVTNATRVDHRLAGRLGESNLTRICVSVDGADNATHGAARGKNLPRVLAGLRPIRATGKPVTVITVVHRGNVERVLDLSVRLAAAGMADQHHLCAPSYSGEARAHYANLRLGREDYLRLQDRIDAAHHTLAGQGLFVTFNSFWPATGRRSPVLDGGRRITLQQLREQVKNTLLHIRPGGQLQLAAAAWGRETVGDAVIGDVHASDPADLLAAADRMYRDGSVGQLPREVEARHKFQIGPGADHRRTDLLIDTPGEATELADLIPITPLSRLSLLDNPLPAADLADLAAELAADPSNHRLVQHASGPYLVFNRRRAHVTLLHPAELPTLLLHPLAAATA